MKAKSHLAALVLLAMAAGACNIDGRSPYGREEQAQGRAGASTSTDDTGTSREPGESTELSDARLEGRTTAPGRQEVDTEDEDAVSPQDPRAADDTHEEDSSTGCELDDDVYSDGSDNPYNDCELCRHGQWIAKADGSPCDDGSSCTLGDACEYGYCQGHARDCAGELGCNDGERAYCDEPTGECRSDSVCNGTPRLPVGPPPSVIDVKPVPSDLIPAFYTCSSHAECAPGSACVAHAGNSQTFCKPFCSTDTDCDRYPYATSCQPVAGYSVMVCNDGPSTPSNATGSVPAFFTCSSQADCVLGTACVRNEPGGQTYCKPYCSTNQDCQAYAPYQTQCLRVQGEAASICDDRTPQLL